MPWKLRRLLIIGMVAPVGIAAFLVLALVPVRHQFSLSGVAIYDPNRRSADLDTAAGTTIVFHWSAPSATKFSC